MKLKIDGRLGTVRIDLTTDPDHLAKYGLYLWRQLPSKQWEEILESITPAFSHTLNPEDHHISLSATVLDDCWLVIGAKVNAVTQNPGPLDFRVTIRQDPGPPGSTGSKIASHRVNYTKPVTPGKDLNLTAEYQFDLK